MPDNKYIYPIEYRAWVHMRQRCNNPNNPGYLDYGGRGIRVCDRWNKFENFLTDMGERPEDRSLDRINNDGNYEPSNCRWATRKTQNNNKRLIYTISNYCRRGHILTDDNVYITSSDGARTCLICRKASKSQENRSFDTWQRRQQARQRNQRR